MRKEYPKFKRNSTEDIYKNLSATNRKIIDDFLTFVSATAGKKRTKNTRRLILQIQDIIDNQLNKITTKDIISFASLLNNCSKLEESKNDVKRTFKRFIKYYFTDWKERFGEPMLKTLHLKDGTNHKKINSATKLKNEEIDKLIKGAGSIKNRAMVVTTYESAGRPEEIRNLTWERVDFHDDKKRVLITLISQKTGKPRPLLLEKSYVHLKRHYNECDDVEKDDVVFSSPDNSKRPVSMSSFTEYFKRLGERTLKKSIFPYLFRHTRLSYLLGKLSPKAYEKFAGHSIDVAIKSYAHLSDDDVREELESKIYNAEELSEDKKEEIKTLRKELNKLKKDDEDQTKKLKKLIIESSRNFKLLKDLSSIVQIMLKAAVSDKKTETYFKKQLNKILPAGKTICSIR